MPIVNSTTIRSTNSHIDEIMRRQEYAEKEYWKTVAMDLIEKLDRIFADAKAGEQFALIKNMERVVVQKVEPPAMPGAPT